MTPEKRILIVDDEPVILNLLEQMLVAEGYMVITASDGDEACQLWRAQWFDLFLIDLIMPRKDGIETILALRAFRRNAPIIAMSGGWQDGRRNCLPLAGKIGACGTLAKPFDHNTLLETVRTNLVNPPSESRQQHHHGNHTDAAVKEGFSWGGLASTVRAWHAMTASQPSAHNPELIGYKHGGRALAGLH